MDESPLAGEARGMPARWKVFTLLGVPWMVTAQSWQFVPTRLIPCTIIALVFHPNESISARLLFGGVYALLLMLTQVTHIVGHTLSGKYVGAPMDENIIVQTKIWTYYRDTSPELPKRVHLGRALGGPLLNIAVGVVALGVWLAVGGHALLFYTLANLGLGLAVLLPFPGVDGGVIWREMRR